MTSREEALKILNEHVKSESLKRHCFAVAAAMEAYAEKFLAEGKLVVPSTNTPLQFSFAKLSNANENFTARPTDEWWICGVLHDFDWEIHPTLEAHPIEGVKILREKGVDEEILTAILGHNDYTKVPRESLMAKTLFAVDELSGLIVALARVRPARFDGMTADSVKKAMKKKDFAANVSREEIKKGILELGVEEVGHYELVIGALSKIKGDLGFE